MYVIRYLKSVLNLDKKSGNLLSVLYSIRAFKSLFSKSGDSY